MRRANVRRVAETDTAPTWEQLVRSGIEPLPLTAVNGRGTIHTEPTILSANPLLAVWHKLNGE